MDDDINGEFKMFSVSQVISASDIVFRKMCQELNFDNIDTIKQCHLNKRSVPKEKLAEWLETVCNILDSFSVPLLKNAVSTIDCIAERIDELQRDKNQDR